MCSSPLLLQRSFSLTWPNSDPNYCSSQHRISSTSQGILSFSSPPQPFQAFVSHQILEILSFNQGQKRLFISHTSFLLPAPLALLPSPTFPYHSHICGATAFQWFYTPTTGLFLSFSSRLVRYIDLHTARGFMDLLISRRFKVCLARYHMKTARWAILHPITVDGIVQHQDPTQHFWFISHRLAFMLF